MKNVIKIFIYLILLFAVVGCKERPGQEKYYLFETADYTDFDDSCRVIYLKSHRQLLESHEFYMIGRVPNEYSHVYNAFGHPVSRDYKNPRITIDTLDPGYDITIHMHSPADSVVVINSAVKLKDLNLQRYYMPEIVKVDSIKSVFQFLYPLSMVKDIEVDGTMYTIWLENYEDIDFKNGERVVLEYSDYKIPIPYQIFIQ